MDALLLDKAELQQSLVLSRKDLESNKQKSKVKHTDTESVLEAQHETILGIMKLDFTTLFICLGGTSNAWPCHRRSPNQN